VTIALYKLTFTIPYYTICSSRVLSDFDTQQSFAWMQEQVSCKGFLLLCRQDSKNLPGDDRNGKKFAMILPWQNDSCLSFKAHFCNCIADCFDHFNSLTSVGITSIFVCCLLSLLKSYCIYNTGEKLFGHVGIGCGWEQIFWVEVRMGTTIVRIGWGWSWYVKR